MIGEQNLTAAFAECIQLVLTYQRLQMTDRRVLSKEVIPFGALPEFAELAVHGFASGSTPAHWWLDWPLISTLGPSETKSLEPEKKLPYCCILQECTLFYRLETKRWSNSNVNSSGA